MTIELKDRAQGPAGNTALSPDFTVILVRELCGILTRLADRSSGATVSGGSTLVRLFGPEIANARVSYREIERREGSVVGNFRAWPVYISDGWRNIEAAVYNRDAIEKTFAEFFPNKSSHIRGGIGEAVRNIGQHGHHQRGVFMVGSEEARFAPGGVFLQALRYQTDDGRSLPVLLAVVADEGDGIGSPSASLIDGQGDTTRGSQQEGMGIELSSSLLYVVKARNGEWLLYDRSVLQPTTSARGRSIEPVCSLNLPQVPQGCQKVMFFASPLDERLQQDPHAVAQRAIDDETVKLGILRALETLKR